MGDEAFGLWLPELLQYPSDKRGHIIVPQQAALVLLQRLESATFERHRLGGEGFCSKVRESINHSKLRGAKDVLAKRLAVRKKEKTSSAVPLP